MTKKKTVSLMLKMWFLATLLMMGCRADEAVLYVDTTETAVSIPETVEVSGAIRGEDDSNATRETETPDTIVVHVCGAVKEAGVYELEADARVMDAVDAAGGMTQAADEDYVNLAACIVDGDKVRIPTKEEVKNAMNEKMAGTNSSFTLISNTVERSSGIQDTASKVNINTAGTEELCSLPGIGQTRAAAILAYRQENGNFSAIEDIMQVSGIKENCFQKIKDMITVN